jgi:hypothetical protein
MFGLNDRVNLYRRRTPAGSKRPLSSTGALPPRAHPLIASDTAQMTQSADERVDRILTSGS